MTFARNEIISSTMVVRQFSSLIKSLLSQERQKIGVVRNNEMEAVILSIDEYERLSAQAERAEQLESLLFISTGCCGIDTMHSRGDTVTCSHCSASFRYNEYGMLEGAPFKTVKEFAAWQKERVK